MQTWIVPPSNDDATEPIDVGRLAAALMDALGTPTFGRTVLDSVTGAIDAGSMCAYRVVSRAARDAAPTRYCSASLEARDRTGSCWNAYRDGIYRADETFDELATALRDSSEACAVGHMTADDVRYGPHRKRIYEDHALLARLTVAGREANGDLVAVNFYHHCSQGYFDDRALARFETVAAPILAAVRRHHAWIEPRVAHPVTRVERVADFERRLGERAPTLTTRERAVCARLLAGLLYAGIAEDLDVSLPTVKTYRTRAFERLGIHFRNELFALVDDRVPRTA